MNGKSTNNLNFQEFFLSLLESLSAREKEVLIKRHQLTADLADSSTLKEIGDTFGITRERVRQIEKEAINKLSKQAMLEEQLAKLDQLKADLNHFLERKGGVVTEDSLVKEHVLPKYDFDQLHLNSFLFTLNFLVADVKRVEDSDVYHSFWRVADLKPEILENFLNRLEQKLVEKKNLTPEEEMFEMIEKEILSDVEKENFDVYLQKHEDLNYRNFIESFLTITKKIKKNILNHWGLTEWQDVKPRKLSDKISLIFKHQNQPLHFRDLAENINQANFDAKKICAATVHNELIANGNYVLIGRGIYAPKDWGYMAGTVADVVMEILTKSEKPLSKEDIYEEVLKQRKVNPSTIYLALINKNKFQKLDNGLFTLNK
jgi:hypothetical protein